MHELWALGRSISGDNERTAFFAGAGVSVESGLPNFRQFSEHLLSSTLPRHKDITGGIEAGGVDAHSARNI